eukprot:580103_1
MKAGRHYRRSARTQTTQTCRSVGNDCSLCNPPLGGFNLGYIKKLRPLPGRGDSVFLAVFLPSGEKFVLKTLDKENGLYPPSSSYHIEKDIHLSLSHPNVVRTVGAFETDTNVYLMMEYAEHGDLFDTVLKPDHNEVRAARFLRDVLRGVQYIHSLGVTHRDIKAENVVLTSSNSCKVVDFGFPTRLPRGAKSLNDHLVAGTIDYLSPEIIRKRPYNHCVDILWALGVCRHVPFAPRSNMIDSAFARRAVVTKSILAVDMYRGPTYRAISHEAKDFIERLLIRNPEKRMSVEDMLAHTFLNVTERAYRIQREVRGDSVSPPERHTQTVTPTPGGPDDSQHTSQSHSDRPHSNQSQNMQSQSASSVSPHAHSRSSSERRSSIHSTWSTCSDVTCSTCASRSSSVSDSSVTGTQHTPGDQSARSSRSSSHSVPTAEEVLEEEGESDDSSLVNPVCATTDRVMTKESLILSYSREACMEGAPATRPGAQSETPRYPSPTSADCVTGTTRITRSGHHSGTHTTGAPSPHVACTPSPGHMSAAASPREFAPGSAGSVGQSGYNFDVRLRPSISPIPAAVTREDSGSYLYEVTGAVANLQVSATVADHIPTSGNDVSQCERELECERPPSGTHNQSVRKADSKNR